MYFSLSHIINEYNNDIDRMDTGTREEKALLRLLSEKGHRKFYGAMGFFA